MFSFLSLKRKFLMGHSRPLFRYFVFSIQLTLGKRKLYINIGSWLDSNRGPIVPKATALPNLATTTTLIRKLLGFKSKSGIEQSKRGAQLKQLTKLYCHLIDPTFIPDFLGEMCLNLALGLVTSYCSCQTAYWIPGCFWLGRGSNIIGDPRLAVQL